MFVHRYAGQDVCESHGWYRRAPLDLTQVDRVFVWYAVHGLFV